MASSAVLQHSTHMQNKLSLSNPSLEVSIFSIKLVCVSHFVSFNTLKVNKQQI